MDSLVEVKTIVSSIDTAVCLEQFRLFQRKTLQCISQLDTLRLWSKCLIGYKQSQCLACMYHERSLAAFGVYQGPILGVPVYLTVRRYSFCLYANAYANK